MAEVRVSDLCYIHSLHDGMSIVAKEIVAAGGDEHGVIILSQFTDAASELTEASAVDPYDNALTTERRMLGEDPRQRMRAKSDPLSELDVYGLSSRRLVDAAQLGDRRRLWGRLSAGAESTGMDLP